MNVHLEREEAGERSSIDQLLIACGMIAVGGVLLGLQRQADGSFCGTGFASLGMGALIALLPMLFALVSGSAAAKPMLPHTWLAALSSLVGFAGLTFVAGGVLVPGGPWMFIEAIILLLVLSRRGSEGEISGVRVSHGTILWLVVFLFARLWVTYQGVQNEWAAISFEVPFLSSMPWLPASMRHFSLGDFTAAEFGIPEQGLHYSHTISMWASGFAITIGGLWWRHRAGVECENDRVHETIHRLPPAYASLVELILPEDEWRELGLHGLNERQRRKRVAALTQERVVRQVEFNRAFLVGRPAIEEGSPAFVNEIHQVIESYTPPLLEAPRVVEEQIEND